MTLQISVKGIDALKRKLDTRSPAFSGALKGGLLKSGLIVQADAQKAVHSPDNPYVGVAGHSVATGRLQASIGTSDVTGSGLNQTVKVGTPYGKTGTGSFGRSARRGPRGGRGRQPGGTALTGGHRNKSDPQVYGPIEERRHPFLGPALERNIQRIVDLIERSLEGFWR